MSFACVWEIIGERGEVDVLSDGNANLFRVYPVAFDVSCYGDSLNVEFGIRAYACVDAMQPWPKFVRC